MYQLVSLLKLPFLHEILDWMQCNYVSIQRQMVLTDLKLGENLTLV